MGMSTFEVGCRYLVDRVMAVARNLPNPEYALSVVLAMDQLITSDNIALGLGVRDDTSIDEVISKMAATKALEPSTEPGLYMLRPELQHAEYFEALLGKVELIHSGPASVPVMAGIMTKLAERVSFSRERFTPEMIAAEQFNTSVGVGSPQSASPTPHDALASGYDFLHGIGVAMFGHISYYHGAATPELRIEREGENYRMIMPNKRFEAGKAVSGLPMSYSYQQALKHEQQVLVGIVAKGLAQANITALVEPAK